MAQKDFVIPVKCNNLIIRTVVECISQFYNPRNIYIITSEEFIHQINENSKYWSNVSNIILLDENDFFVKNFGLTKSMIENFYTYKDENSREFGWWYQQILKLGAASQIENISDPYVVWDSDLIALHKWDIYPNAHSDFYQFAILQEYAKNEWNKAQYSQSIYDVIQKNAIEPEEGTFVTHHFVFHHCVLDHFLTQITTNNEKLTWIERIMRLSDSYYRFSEYKCISTYMHHYFPHLFHYHAFHKYGKNGIRYRETENIMKLITENLTVPKHGLSYKEFVHFVNKKYSNEIPYIQIEHLSSSQP
jgi:hypothetical protein